MSPGLRIDGRGPMYVFIHNLDIVVKIFFEDVFLRKLEAMKWFFINHVYHRAGDDKHCVYNHPVI